MNPRHTLFVAALAVVTLLGGACATVTRAPEPDPVAALEAWHDALVRDDPRAAFALLDPDAREGLDSDGFVALYQRQKAALISQAERLLQRVRSQPPRERARVKMGESVAELERTAEGWRLVAPIRAPASAPSPQ